ncbi:MAG TPA: FAD-dependent oxidoreductase, partial [Candidatus Paceibacterota bacterium]|nr:FAD-dependent oxidoreductase [Candidatus Paceibacterota bacterium]
EKTYATLAWLDSLAIGHRKDERLLNSVVSKSSTIILVGAGHAHLHVVAQAEALIERGARVMLIDPGVFWYSGLATGMLGGMYGAAEDQVDPRALAEAHGVEFIQDRVAALETGVRRLRLAGGGDLTYDYVSLTVGSQVNAAIIEGAANDPSVWPVKPISNLWKLREYLESRFRAGQTPRVAVIGGGPTGSEVAANLTALASRHGNGMSVTLITSSAGLIPQAPSGTARALQRKLTRLEVDIRLGTRIIRREGAALIAADGSRFMADVVVLANGLEANPLVEKIGLPTRTGIGLRINRRLHSIADDRVFASGDCTAMEDFNLPKLGVFGVRQAAYIHANLVASLEGKPLADYTPQKHYLAILNLGDGTALAMWGPFWWIGRSSMWLKDWIDRRFLDYYRQSFGNNPPQP